MSDLLPSKVGLSRRALLKQPARLENFVQRYSQQKPFVKQGDTEPSIYLEYTQEVLDQLNQQQIPTEFTDSQGNIVRLSELQKTPEFGGKYRGCSTIAEDIALTSLQNQLDSIKSYEYEDVELTVGDETINACSVVSTPGTPKSDFHFVDSRNNEVAWVSHKDGYSASCFGQWGGISSRELESVYQDFPEVYDEVTSFIEDVRDFVGNEMPRATTIARPISSSQLKMVSVYGKAYGNDLGRQNVTAVIQGAVKIKNGQLVGTSCSHSNAEELDREYEPMLMAMYKGDRDQFGIKGARFSIYPARGRKIHHRI